ncbi:unnamed protein product, partial [Phaeothamnion confervicola]
QDSRKAAGVARCPLSRSPLFDCPRSDSTSGTWWEESFGFGTGASHFVSRCVKCTRPPDGHRTAGPPGGRREGLNSLDHISVHVAARWQRAFMSSAKSRGG